MQDLTNQLLAVLLLSLRVAPALAFAQPFTLLRVPAPVRLLLAVGLSLWLVAGHPQQTWQGGFVHQPLLATALAELFLGVALALPLQLAFAALLTVGRAVDIQAGFGMAMLVDPATRGQTPLVGTLFAYAAAIVFFATDGPASLLAIWSVSVDQIPLGTTGLHGDVGQLGGYMSALFLMAFGVAGLIMLILFILDLAIAFLSRTLPQMNVLVLGFQVKTLATLVTLPLAIGLSTATLLGMMRFALETAMDLAGHG